MYVNVSERTGEDLLCVHKALRNPVTNYYLYLHMQCKTSIEAKGGTRKSVQTLGSESRKVRQNHVFRVQDRPAPGGPIAPMKILELTMDFMPSAHNVRTSKGCAFRACFSATRYGPLNPRST